MMVTNVDKENSAGVWSLYSPALDSPALSSSAV